MLRRWNRPNGYRQVLVIGLPLVVSMGSQTLMLFTDRVFLAGYSLDAIAAALPAGIMSFFCTCFFLGVASYVNVFVAQYTGAGQPEKVAASVWQGLYFSLFSGLFLAAFWLLAEVIFALGGHPPEVRHLETSYFRVVIVGSWPTLASAALGAFFSGRGLTRPVMVCNLLGAAVNIPLDYLLINGLWGFPEMGIVGAGLATSLANFLTLAGLVWAVFAPREHRAYRLWANRIFDRELFLRLLRFGLPGGGQFLIDVFATTFFVFFIGRLGTVELAASNIAFSFDTVAFLPMMGLHVAVESLVGQAIGAGRPDEAAEATRSTLHLTLAYLLTVGLVFLAFPATLMELFRPRDLVGPAFAPVLEKGVVLIRFVALYTLLDGLYLIYTGALKGAGDTAFVMLATAVLSTFFLTLPVYVGITFLGWELFDAWLMVSIYIGILSLCFWWRFRRGKWRGMKVI